MRAVQCDSYHTFVHSHQCKIDSQSRTSCKKCRLEKCLEAGMKISYVKTLQENCQKVVKCQKIKEVEFQEDFVDEKSLEQLHDAQWFQSCAGIFRCYSQNPQAFLIQTCQVPQVTVFNTDHFLMFMDYIDSTIHYQNCLLMAQRDETNADLNVLLRHNMPKMSQLYQALLFMVRI